MPVFDIGPGWLEVDYTANAHQHKMRLPCVYVGTPTPGSMPSVVLKDLTSLAADTALTAFLTVVKPFFKTTDAFNNCTAWYKSTPTSAPVSLHQFNVGIAGTSANTPILAGQFVMTFRSLLGHHWRLYLMETGNAINVIVKFPYTGFSGTLAIHNYVIGGTSFIVARDGSYLSTSLRTVTKLNDALRKRFILSV